MKRPVGLSQTDLDALCSYEVSAEEPSSPVGASMLARKRQFQKVTSTKKECPIVLKLGLSQEQLDAMSAPAQQLEDMPCTSPIGASLHSIKNRRRWAAVAEPESVEITVTPPVDAPFHCPASWGGCGGLSQAELDAMCGEETAAPTEEAPASVRTALSPIRSSPKENVMQNSPLEKSTSCSPLRSPTSPLRRRKLRRNTLKANLENAMTPVGSPVKSIERASPGDHLSPQILSPQIRSPTLR